MDWTTISTIAGIALAAATALGVWLGPRLVEQSRRRFETRQAHFTQIKKEVLSPLLCQLEEHYIPVIVGRLQNVVSTSTFEVLPDAAIGEFGGTRKIHLSIVTIDNLVEKWEEQDSFDVAVGRERSAKPAVEVSQALYSDLTNHDRGLVDRWDRFVAEVDVYNHRCLQYVKSLEQWLAKQTGLAVWTEYKNTLGISAADMAAMVWGRQLGLDHTPVKALESANRWQLNHGDRIVAIGTEQEMRECHDAVQVLVRDTTRVAELRNLAMCQALEEEAHEIREALIDFSESRRLKGDCRFTKI